MPGLRLKPRHLKGSTCRRTGMWSFKCAGQMPSCQQPFSLPCWLATFSGGFLVVRKALIGKKNWLDTGLLCPRDSPDKNTGVGCHALLQGIFLTQGSNPHWQVGSSRKPPSGRHCGLHLPEKPAPSNKEQPLFSATRGSPSAATKT